MSINHAAAVALGASILFGSATAQERKPTEDKPAEAKPEQPQKAVPIRAMRLTGGGTADRAPPTQEELTSRYEQKIAGEWLKNAKWILDFDEARAMAKESGKPLFAYFTRSYSP